MAQIIAGLTAEGIKVPILVDEDGALQFGGN